MPWPANKRPMCDHSGETYGALQVGAIIPRASDRDRQDYHMTWTCCGKTGTLSQSTLNAHRLHHPDMCGQCSGKESKEAPELRLAHRRECAVKGGIEDRGGMYWPVLGGWSGEAKLLDRRFADE